MTETRTNIVLNDKLVAQAMRKAGVTTKKAAIEAALRAFVREPDWAALSALEGSQAIAPDYDPGALFAGDAALNFVCEPRPVLGKKIPSATAPAATAPQSRRKK